MATCLPWPISSPLLGDLVSLKAEQTLGSFLGAFRQLWLDVGGAGVGTLPLRALVLAPPGSPAIVGAFPSPRSPGRRTVGWPSPRLTAPPMEAAPCPCFQPWLRWRRVQVLVTEAPHAPPAPSQPVRARLISGPPVRCLFFQEALPDLPPSLGRGPP